MKLRKYHKDKISETTGIYIKIQHWGGNRNLSMKVIYMDFPRRNESKGSVSKDVLQLYTRNNKEQNICNLHSHMVPFYNKIIYFGLYISEK